MAPWRFDINICLKIVLRLHTQRQSAIRAGTDFDLFVGTFVVESFLARAGKESQEMLLQD